MTKSFQLDSLELRAIYGTMLCLAVLFEVTSGFPRDYQDHPMIAVLEIVVILSMAAYTGYALVLGKNFRLGFLVSSLVGLALMTVVVLNCTKDKSWPCVTGIVLVQSQFVLCLKRQPKVSPDSLLDNKAQTSGGESRNT